MKHNITIIKPKLHGQAMTIIIDGVTYSSLSDLRCHFRVSESHMRKCRKEMKLSLEEVIDHILCKIEQKKEERKNRILKAEERDKKYVELHRFIYKGITYPSFAYAIESLNKEGYALTANYISTIAKKESITKQEAIDLFLERRKLRRDKALALYYQNNHL